MEREMVVQRVWAGIAKARADGRHIRRVKTRPSEMIRKILVRGSTFRNCAFLCKTSQGSVSLEAKEMRNEFRSGRVPTFLTLDDVLHSPFLAGEDKRLFDLTRQSYLEKKEQEKLPPLPEPINPVAEVQAISKVIQKQAS